MPYTSNLIGIKKKIEGNSRASVEAGANAWRNAILQKLTGSRSGRVYKVPGAISKTYTASAPGESPATATGDLRTSYAIKIVSNTEALVGSPLRKATFLEKGTKFIKPRPHFIVAYEENKDNIIEAMKGKFRF